MFDPEHPRLIRQMEPVSGRSTAAVCGGLVLLALLRRRNVHWFAIGFRGVSEAEPMRFSASVLFMALQLNPKPW
jgi:hypothetical protein